MTDRPTFDPFAALAAARSKTTASEGCETFAALSQDPKTAISEEVERVSDNFRTFAAFAGVSDPRAASPSSLYLERKKDFSLSFQGVSRCYEPPLAGRSKPGSSEHAPAPAKPAKLRSGELSDCRTTETPKTAAAKLSQASGRGGASGVLAGRDAAKAPEPADGEDASARFEERAAFLEYECGLSRAEAEAQAQAERAPAGGADNLAGWYVGLSRLDREKAPCPGYRGGEWVQVYHRALAFLDQFGEQAEALGWTGARLFGVHETAGIVRVDACAALTLPVSGEVRAITATEVRFDYLTHREKPGQPAGVPWWEWRR